MFTIDDPRAEKAVQRLARQLGTTGDEAVAVACERMLAEQEERARLADHSHLYGPDGLPK